MATIKQNYNQPNYWIIEFFQAIVVTKKSIFNNMVNGVSIAILTILGTVILILVSIPIALISPIIYLYQKKVLKNLRVLKEDLADHINTIPIYELEKLERLSQPSFDKMKEYEKKVEESMKDKDYFIFKPFLTVTSELIAESKEIQRLTKQEIETAKKIAIEGLSFDEPIPYFYE